MFNDPDWASKEEWDAYAWFGFAIQEAQLLERFLHIILISLSMRKNTSNSDENRWDSLYDKYGRLTLGQLLQRIRKYTEVSDALVENIKKAADIRNELAHTFFWPKDREANDIKADVAQKKLMEAASFFSNLSPQLESVMVSLLDNLSIDRNEAENKTDNYFKT